MRTPRELLAGATAQLANAGIATPRVDAELLLAALLDVPRSRLITRDTIPDSVAVVFDEQVRRRVSREPLQHIIGSAPFRHLVLDVGPGVFVPRPETELLVDAVLPRLHALDAPTVVDLCAGSGALALAIANEVAGARVIAVENSLAATRWLTRNAAGTAVRVITGDVRDPELLRPFYGQADVVVSNPPYVPSVTAVDPEVQADPHDAVFAGVDGLDLLPTVLLRAAQLLKAAGLIAVEHDDTHGDAVPHLLRADGGWCDIADHRDLTGRARYATASRCRPPR